MRVGIVDPEPFFGQALEVAFEQVGTVDVVSRTTDQETATTLARRFRPDVVVSEVALDRGSGLRLTEALSGVTLVVILSRRHDRELLVGAAAAGAAGCLGHDLSPARLAELLTRVNADRFVVDEERLRSTLTSAVRRLEDHGTFSTEGLTRREAEILRLVGRGLDDEDIAELLSVSAHTVRTHVGRIRRKLGVHSRAEVARIAVRSDAQATANVLHIQGPALVDD